MYHSKKDSRHDNPNMGAFAKGIHARFIKELTMTNDDELQQWLDAEAAKAAAEAAERAAKAKAFKMPSFEQLKFNFQRNLYAAAIGAKV